MKRYLYILLIVLVSIQGFTQRINPHMFDSNILADDLLDTGANLTNDTTIDVVHYHIDVEIALDSAYIQGVVSIGMFSLIDDLTFFKLDLDDAYQIENITGNVSGFSFNDNQLQINLLNPVDAGNYFEVGIQYKGVPVLAGGYKGLRYETHDDDELIIATLSTPYLAHTWWPCKDGTQDKADSVFMDITIKDTTVASIPVVALSNGLLDTVITIGNKKKFMWKHRYPVVPYYVMAAISNFTYFEQEIIGEGYSFPIEYYVFDSHYNDAVDGVALMPEAMMFFTETFGPYPFRDEKYGMTQLGYYGAIAEWFDLDLVVEVANSNPENLILLIGNDTVGAKEKVSSIDNIKFVGEVDYEELPFYLYSFDVCLLPFKVIPLTLATNPVKVYEYLSAGKAIVSVDLPEMSQFNNLIEVATSEGCHSE